ncbi:MAG: CpXC domain-containing protein [Pseudomonadota bacterium]|nr:CpXC domain-containing protein [Pseudomonadota bacterium]
MSTWYPYRLACPACAAPGSIALLKGIHISRLPMVKADIREGRFQVYTCPECGHRTQVEAPSVYTDFPNGQFIAVEAPNPPDLPAARRRGREVFDACFTFGPDIAATLGASIRHRLVFGVAALREKVLAWDAGLDDRVVEALKLDLLAEEGFGRKDHILRLVAVLPGLHLLFARLRPPVTADRVPHPAPEGGALPPGVPRPAAGIGATVCRGAEVEGHVTVPALRYERALQRRAHLLREHLGLSDEWVVDVYVGG